MAGNIRKTWREVKKKHPDFEKNKAFKADLGPNLDKLEKSTLSALAKVNGIGAYIKEILQHLSQCQAIMKSYKHVAETMEDELLEQDLDEIEGELDDHEKFWEDVQGHIDEITSSKAV